MYGTNIRVLNWKGGVMLDLEHNFPKVNASQSVVKVNASQSAVKKRSSELDIAAWYDIASAVLR